VARQQAQKQEAQEIQAAQMQLVQAQENAAHAKEVELLQLEQQMSGMIRGGLEKMKREGKLISDKMKTDTAKLIKLADIDSKAKENNGNSKRKPDQR